MAADPVDEAAGRLYGLPFEDFVRERDARARELRRAGDKEAAAQVAKLAKPSQVAWAANQLARAGAEELLAAGEALREAQLGGGGREALRAATAAERAAVEELVREAPKPGGRALSRDGLDRLRGLLHAVARDEAVRAEFVGGRMVVAEPAEGGAWPSGAFGVPASTPASKGGTKRGGGREAPPKRDRQAAEGSEPEQAERRAREATERGEREAARKREEAERRKLERRLKAARAAAEDARNRLEAAREAYESATHEVARIEEQLG